MERKWYLVILARQLGLELSGQDILQVSIGKFLQACPGIRIITILPSECVRQWKDYCSIRNFNCPQHVLPAGFTPFHSIRKALERIPPEAFVAIHDGDRPFVSVFAIAAMVRKAEAGVRAVVPYVAAPGAIKVRTATGAYRSLSGGFFLSQMPQVFRAEDLQAAYAQAYDTAFSDPASVVEKINIPLSPVEGEKWNVRVETAEDLAAGRAAISAKNS